MHWIFNGSHFRPTICHEEHCFEDLIGGVSYNCFQILDNVHVLFTLVLQEARKFTQHLNQIFPFNQLDNTYCLHNLSLLISAQEVRIKVSCRFLSTDFGIEKGQNCSNDWLDWVRFSFSLLGSLNWPHNQFKSLLVGVFWAEIMF